MKEVNYEVSIQLFIGIFYCLTVSSPETLWSPQLTTSLFSCSTPQS